MKKEKIIVYGLGEDFRGQIYNIKKKFDIVGYSDSNQNKKYIAEQENGTFIKPEDINKYKYDYIAVTTCYYDEVKSFLVNNINVDSKKILSNEEMWARAVYKGNGTLNEDKVFFVIETNWHRCGLFYNYRYILDEIDFALKKGYYPIVDYENFRNFYLDKDTFGVKNSWEYYFENSIDISLEEVYKSKNVIFSMTDDTPITDFYSVLKDKEKRNYYKNITRKYMRINKKSLKVIEDEYNKLFPKDAKVCGVLCRGTDYTNLKPYNHGVQPSVDMLMKKVEEVMKERGYDYVYLATEDNEACQRFKEKFSDKLICTNQRRFEDTDKKWLDDINFDRSNDRYIRGMEYLTSIALLSRCDALIGGRCSGLIGALLLNEEYEYEYIFELGRYGVDEVK